MNIKYLISLSDTPERDGFINEPISLDEIASLERTYNGGVEFPKALKELLLLAGDYCTIFDYGLSSSQHELQEFVRENLREENKSISCPFFAVDVYNAYDQFLFVYLDEGDDPPVYEALYFDEMIRQNGWIRKVNNSLSNLVTMKIQAVKEGFNPF